MADALHHVAVAEQGVGCVVHDGLAGPVVAAGEKALGDGHAHAVGGALPERPGAGLDSGGGEGLGVARGARAPLPESLDVLHVEVVAGQVLQRVEQHRPVAGREHEAVAIRPRGVLGVVTQVPMPQHVCHGRGTQGKAGVAGIGLLDGVDGQKTDGVDRKLGQGIHQVGAPPRTSLACSLLARWRENSQLLRRGIASRAAGLLYAASQAWLPAWTWARSAAPIWGGRSGERKAR